MSFWKEKDGVWDFILNFHFLLHQILMYTILYFMLTLDVFHEYNGSIITRSAQNGLSVQKGQLCVMAVVEFRSAGK